MAGPIRHWGRPDTAAVSDRNANERSRRQTRTMARISTAPAGLTVLEDGRRGGLPRRLDRVVSEATAGIARAVPRHYPAPERWHDFLVLVSTGSYPDDA